MINVLIFFTYAELADGHYLSFLEDQSGTG